METTPCTSTARQPCCAVRSLLDAGRDRSWPRPACLPSCVVVLRCWGAATRAGLLGLVQNAHLPNEQLPRLWLDNTHRSSQGLSVEEKTQVGPYVRHVLQFSNSNNSSGTAQCVPVTLTGGLHNSCSMLAPVRCAMRARRAVVVGGQPVVLAMTVVFFTLPTQKRPSGITWNRGQHKMGWGVPWNHGSQPARHAFEQGNLAVVVGRSGGDSQLQAGAEGCQQGC